MKTMEERYRAAEKLLPWNVAGAVLNGAPQVFEVDEKHFGYALEQREEDEVYAVFRKVNTEDGSEEDLFDHEKLCDLLECGHLPFASCTVIDGKIFFDREGESFVYDPCENTLQSRGFENKAVSVSPDETKEIFVRDHDLWLKDRKTQKETRLTWDGEKDFAYGEYAEYSGFITAKVKGEAMAPDVLWAPDSVHFLTVKLDQRKVKELYVLQSYDDEHLESIRPRLHTYKCAFPEDEDVPLAHYYLGNAEDYTVVKLDMEPQPAGGPVLGGYMASSKWMDDSSAFYTTLVRRGNKSASFILVNTDGEVKELYREDAQTSLNIRTHGQLDGFGHYWASNYLSADRQILLWQSERDDYARLFRYDGNGTYVGPVTPDTCAVGELIRADDENAYIYFYASILSSMSDPCYQAVCRVHYDGSGFEVLTPEDAMHRCEIVNDMIIDTYSRVDLPPVTVLRKTDGTFVRELVKADISGLMDRGYIVPERFTVKASDGKTDLYGILIRPADFDPDKTYPFIDYIYGGMQTYNVPKAFAYEASIEGREIMGGLEELAQLGFAGIILDGLGTPGRGKKLHEISYENIHGCAGLKDHVYVLPQLKQMYPFLDLDRAGMWGNSGGGCATSRAMLEYPDVYKVGVSSAGNHDQRMYNNQWTETYYGLYNRDIYIQGDNTSLAKNLKGKLYIVHGAMDDNVAMSQSIRLVDALIKEDKDFDFLILPRTNHNVPANPYFIRRKLDYFVRYLLNEEVPAYRFALPEEMK